MSIENYEPQPLNERSEAKVMDVYKVYSDRTSAIRTTMGLILPITLFAMGVTINHKQDVLYRFGLSGALAALGISFAVYLRVKLNHLVEDYEKIILIDHRRGYYLLPLDSMMDASSYLGGKSEISYFWRFANIIPLVGAALFVGALLILALQPNLSG